MKLKPYYQLTNKQALTFIAGVVALKVVIETVRALKD